MKTLGIFAAGLLIPIIGLADTIVSPGILVGVPQNFQSTTGSGTPFWNNTSTDGPNMNVGDYLTGSNPAMGTTDYLGTGGTFGDYLSTGGSSPDAPNFTFLQSALSVQATLLFTDASSNYTYGLYGFSGTQIGLYNVANPSQNETLFSAGTLYNPSAPNGIYNNNVTPQTPVGVGSWANYGVYAYTCWFDANYNPSCKMYYSDASLNPASDPNHERFSLFEDPSNPSTYYIGFEDGVNPSEGYGDYNDVIFKLQTTQIDPPANTFSALFSADDPPGGDPPAVTPEPATFSILGLGLVGLGLLRRSRVKKGLQ